MDHEAFQALEPILFLVASQTSHQLQVASTRWLRTECSRGDVFRLSSRLAACASISYSHACYLLASSIGGRRGAANASYGATTAKKPDRRAILVAFLRENWGDGHLAPYHSSCNAAEER